MWTLRGPPEYRRIPANRFGRFEKSSLVWHGKLKLCNKQRAILEIVDFSRSLGIVANAQESGMGPKVESLHKQRY